MNKIKCLNLPERLLAVCVLCGNNIVWAEPLPLEFPTTEEEIVNALTRGPDRGPGGTTKDKPKIGALINFNFNSAAILPESEPLLHEYGRALQGGLANAMLIIAGHTDSVGTKAYNLSLSYRRAQAVKKFLVSHHEIVDQRFIIKAYGESQPIDTNETAQGRAINRRVEFTRVE